MARPTSKKDLLALGEENFEKLFALVDSFSKEEQRAEYIFDNNRDKNIRDILVHLHHWHLMVMEWYKVGMRGEKPDIPAKGYNWRTLPALNKEIWQMYQDKTFDEAVELLNSSYKDVRKIIEHHGQR